MSILLSSFSSLVKLAYHCIWLNNIIALVETCVLPQLVEKYLGLHVLEQVRTDFVTLSLEKAWNIDPLLDKTVRQQ